MNTTMQKWHHTARLSWGLLCATALVAGGITITSWVYPVAWLETALAYGAVGLCLVVIGLLYRSGRVHQERESRIRAIVDRAADGILMIDADGRIEKINPAAEAMFGYRAAELVNHKLPVLLTSAYPDEPEDEGCLDDFLRANAIPATGTAREVVGLRRDGSKFFMGLSISEAEVDGRTIFVAIVRDVTDRKRVQLALRDAHDALEQRVEDRTRELQAANKQLRAEIDERERTEAERERLLKELQRALAEIKTLSGFIPICAHCKKVRDDQGFWSQIETYLEERSDAEFSHGVCPDCVTHFYPEVQKKREQNALLKHNT